MFEQKSSKQPEQKTLCWLRESRIVFKSISQFFYPHNFPEFLTNQNNVNRALSLDNLILLKGVRLWISCNLDTLSNNWRNYGIVAQETSILLLKTTNLHAFVLVTAKAEFVLNMNMLSPLKKLTK